jgi:CopG family transcriptional regulator, nickel-responsive regulator
MQQITITVDDDELVAALDRVIAACGYQNRSEAIPDLARVKLPNSLQGLGLVVLAIIGVLGTWPPRLYGNG